MANVISQTERYTLYAPENTWDTNYYLFDNKTGRTHLIDIHDVHETVYDVNEHGGILFSELCELKNMDAIMDIVWRVK